jgi:hypothetical protein
MSSFYIFVSTLEMDLTMKKFASSLLLALTLAAPLVMPAVQAKPAASQSKVAQATDAKPKAKKSKAKKTAMKKEEKGEYMKKEGKAESMKKTEAPKSAAPATPATPVTPEKK